MKTLNDFNFSGKKAIVRVDFNVPLNEKFEITDETRIKAVIPTVEKILKDGGSAILMSHLGRPKDGPEEKSSLKHIVARLSEVFNTEVKFANDCIGDEAKDKAASLQSGEILLLENLRFYKEETKGDADFAKKLADLGADIYVNDAFGAAHRSHASTAGAARVVTERGGQCAAGLLMERELKFLGEELETPKSPFVVILGGAKVSDKIKVIDRLLEKADTIIIGGAMAYTFKLAKGLQVGKSLVEPDKVDVAQAALEKAKERNVQFLIPTDNVVAEPTQIDGKFAFGDYRINDNENIPDDMEGVDIGPKSAEAFGVVIKGAKTILWNGPMGIFEDSRFAEGTYNVAKAVCEATANGAISIIGGGDSVKALNNAGLGDQTTFMSTGGGASLEFLEGNELPGVTALTDK